MISLAASVAVGVALGGRPAFVRRATAPISLAESVDAAVAVADSAASVAAAADAVRPDGIAGLWYELTHDGPFELVYDDQYFDPDFGAPQIRPIVGARITASGWIGIAISLVQALFAPWGIVEYTKRGGLGPEEGGFLPGGMIRNALRRALVEEPEPEPDEADASAEDDPE